MPERPRLAPLPEHYYPFHRHAQVGYILERARRILPWYGDRVATLQEAEQLTAAAKIHVSRPPTHSPGDGAELGDMDIPAVLLPPLPWDHCAEYILVVARWVKPELLRPLLLHEAAHALGGHFGPEYAHGEVEDLATYPVWEREADLFAAIGYLSPAERAGSAASIRRLLLERVPLDYEEWTDVRVPYLVQTFRRWTLGRRAAA